MHSDNLGVLTHGLEFSVMGAAMFVYISPGSTLWCIKIISLMERMDRTVNTIVPITVAKHTAGLGRNRIRFFKAHQK
jgi:hypothetical protein